MNKSLSEPQSKPSNEPQDELLLISCLGNRGYLRLGKGLSLLRDSVFMYFLALACVIVMVSRDNVHLEALEISSPGLVLSYIFFSTAIILLWFGFVGWAATQLKRRGLISFLFLPIVTLPATPLIYAITAVLTSVIQGEWIDQIFMWDVIIRDSVATLCLEAIFVRFAIPATAHFREFNEERPRQAPIQPSLSPATPPEASLEEEGETTEDLTDDHVSVAQTEENERTSIQAGPHQIPLADLIAVRSDGHYLLFTLTHREFRVRGVLRDFAKTMGLGVGIQINRATWAPYQAITDVTSEGGKLDVTLSNRETERVSNNRRQAFEIAYDEYLSSQKDS